MHDAEAMATQNAAVSAAMRNMGVGVLPAFNASLELWNETIGRRRPGLGNNRILDCTHFCEPASLFTESINPLLLAHWSGGKR